MSNNKLSMARHAIANNFGILAARYGVSVSFII